MTKLDRSIGLVALTLYGVGDILGAGIYGLVGKAAGLMGNGLWLAFLCSFVVALLTGLSYSALCSRYPKAAGSSYVVFKAFNNGFIAFVVGLAALFAGITSMATASRIFGGYFNGLWPSVPISVGAFCFLTIVGAIVWKGVKESIFVNSILTVSESCGLILVVALGVTYIGSVDYFDFTTATNTDGLRSSILLSTSVLVFYSFVGFEDLINMGEEVKDPHRNLPRALIFALLIASSLYLLVAIVAISVVPAAELAASQQPLVEVVRRAAPWFPSNVFSVVALLAVCNTALLNFLMGSRLIYGLASLKILPSFFDQVNPKTKTPTRAIFLVYGITMALALSGDVSTLARATSLLLLLVFISMNLSLIRIKWQQKGVKHGHFDVPTVIPALGALGCGLLLFFGKLEDWYTAGGLIALIVIMYLVAKPKHESIVKMVEE